MLAGFLIGIVDDRSLMREVHVNIAIRRFVGYGLLEAIPRCPASAVPLSFPSSASTMRVG
jgi:hypothetical protein